MKRYTEVRNYDDVGNLLDATVESPTGEYIMVDDLIAWLDKCMSGADILLQFSTTPNKVAKVEGVIDAYKSVKAHIEG